MKQTARRSLTIFVGTLALLTGLGARASAQTPSADLTKQIGIDQNLGTQLPTDVTLKDEAGKDIRVGELLGSRPLVFAPIFYQCTTACMVVRDNLLKTLAKATKGDRLLVGRDLDIVFVSINPKETSDLALRKKNILLESYNQPGSEKGWHFLTGSEKEVRRLTNALGFRYTYDAATDRINHPVGIMIASPQGKITGYIMGGTYPTEILADDIARAERNEVGPKAETFLMGCIMLDPVTGQRRIVIEGVVRLAGILTMLVLFGSIIKMSLSNRTAKRVEAR